MPLSAGSRLGAYEILGPLGAGGMGEVYRARDPKLGRDVAIKVLPEDVARDPDRLARFEREARSLAALNHPGIVTIFAVEEAEGARFLAMELVEGDGLDTLVPPGGLPLPRFLEIAVPLAEALSAAHECGIVHRDLKPGNVMVTREGRVKVLDFGLARVEAADSNPNLTSTPTESRVTNLTSEGQVFGTVAYMSPEQARGARVDARSDVFSLGVVMYEMLTGARPFHGATAVDLISSILRDRPASVAELRADLPPDLAKVVRRCLEKEPRDRYQTSRDVYNELKELRAEAPIAPSAAAPRAEAVTAARHDSGSSRTQAFWIAVFPFTHSGGDLELASFAEGLAEDIHAGLAKFPYLSVISRNSTLRFKTQTSDVRTVGQQLGARYVLEGGIRKGGSVLRVNVQLVDAETGAHLWAETYNRDLRGSDVLAVQDDVTDRVVATVADTSGALVRSMAASVEEKPDAELTATDVVLRHWRYQHRGTPAEHARVRDGLEKFVEREPGHADVWACLARLYVHEFALGFNRRPDPLGRALRAAQRAVDLDPTCQHARAGIAQVHFFRREVPAFRAAAEQAIALNPRDTDTLGVMGNMLADSGDFERGPKLVRRAMELNPHFPDWFRFALTAEHFQKADYAGALDEIARVNMPGFFWKEIWIAACAGLAGRHSEAAAAVEELRRTNPDIERQAREFVDSWLYASGLTDRFMEGLRKAGLEIPAESAPSTLVGERPRSAPPVSGSVTADEAFWVAVLPFRYTGADAGLAALADGLTEDVVTGLSRFSYLKVIARSSTARYASEAVDVRSAGRELGARYVMEGSLRQAGSKLRLAVQLVDATSGAHLWAESYERAFDPSALFEVQDDLVPRIVSTVADMAGVLPRSMSESLRSRSPEQLSAYEAVLRSFGYFERYNPEELSSARSGLEAAVRKAPAYADAWAMLSYLCAQDYVHGYDLQPGALEAAASAARRAVELGPSNHLAWFSLAQSLSYQKDFDSFRHAAERAVELNPMDGSSVALLGELLLYAGSRDRGMQLAERAKRLNPIHAGGYYYADFYDAFSRGDDRGALDFALKSKLRGNPLAPMFIAAAAGQLGDRDQGSTAVRELLKFRPELPALMRKQVAKIWNREYGERFLDGLRKAGLDIPKHGETEPASSTTSSISRPPGIALADEGFSVAVQPFKPTGADKDLAALAEGLSEQIVAGLSRFSYLRVITGGSTQRHADQARYVMSGSLRLVGDRLRVAVQLVDRASGAHLWAENYERTFASEAVFELQDELVPRIVSTVADSSGVLRRSMSEAVRNKSADQLSPYEAVLRSFGYFDRVTAEELAAARSALELAVRKAPGYSDAWAMLALLCAQEYGQGFRLVADALGDGSTAARRAVEAGPSNHLAHSSLAQVLFLQKEFQSFRNAAERTVALNPMDGATVALVGILWAYTGDWEHGCALAERAMRLNPHFPGWYRLASITNAYRTRDYRAALDAALKIQMPGYFWTPVFCAAAYGQLGERGSARKAVAELLAIRPRFGSTAREEFAKWYDADLVEHFIDGLRKAGLEISPEAVVSPVEPTPSTPISAGTRADEGFWIAVLPFKAGGGASELAALAEGMSEEIVAGLSRFSYLRVISRSSTLRYAGEAADGRAVGKELGARYVLDGSLRQAGTRLRIAVQLVDTGTGAQLWSETYDQDFRPEAVFEVQDALAPRIVSTVGDMHGVLPRSMSDALRHRAPDSLSPREALLRSFGYFERVTPEDLAASRSALETAVRKEPAFADAWAMLGLLNVQDYAQGFGLQANSLDSGFDAARRAVDLAPTSPLAHFALAQALFFRKELDKFRHEAERTVSLNPMDGSALALVGEMLGHAGEWERGLALTRRARQLNPNHPGWYWYVDFYDAYRRRDYRAAREVALKIGATSHWGAHLLMAAACAQLGDREAAGRAVEEAVRLRPSVAETFTEDAEKWFDPAFAAHLIDGLRKAGLDVRRAPGAAAAVAPTDAAVTQPKNRRWGIAVAAGVVIVLAAAWIAWSRSAASRPPETAAAPQAIRSLAVLPLDNYSGDPSQDYFAEGMTDELTSQLANLSGLRVISRGSAMQFKGKNRPPTPEIAKKLDVDAVVEGSVIRSGDKVRITAQLIDARSDRHLWAKSFERSSKDVLALQDELAASIAREIHVTLTPAEESRLAKAPSVNPEAYDAYLKGRYFFNRPSDENLTKAIAQFEEATRRDPKFAPAYSGLSDAYAWAGFNEGVLTASESRPKAKAAAEKAIALDDDSAEAHTSLANIKLWYEYDWAGSEAEFRRALALNPNYAYAHDQFGVGLGLQGRFDEAIAEGKRAAALDPLSPSIPLDSATAVAFKGNYEAARALTRRGAELDPTLFFALWADGWIDIQAGRPGDAISKLERAKTMQAPMFASAWLAFAYGASGDRTRALAEFEDLKKKSLRGTPTAFNQALVYLGLGDRARALDYLEKAYASDSEWLGYLKLDKSFDSLRSDPRFQALLKKLGFPG